MAILPCLCYPFLGYSYIAGGGLGPLKGESVLEAGGGGGGGGGKLIFKGELKAKKERERKAHRH